MHFSQLGVSAGVWLGRVVSLKITGALPSLPFSSISSPYIKADPRQHLQSATPLHYEQSFSFKLSTMKVFVLAVVAATMVVIGSSADDSQESTEWPIIPYEFGYEVSDPETNNFHNRAEVKTASGDVFGSYSLLLPTNEVLTLTYNVTGDLGFQYSLVLTPVGSATPKNPE
nr:uncharacterized protein LOC128691286 [Cherax quadricarinatus]